MKIRKAKHLKTNDHKERLKQAKKLILNEIKKIDANNALKYFGCSRSTSFDPKNLDLMQIQILMEIFGVNVGEYNERIYDLMQPIEEEFMEEI